MVPELMFDKYHILPAWAPLVEELSDQPDEYFGGQKTFQFWNEIAHDAPKGLLRQRVPRGAADLRRPPAGYPLRREVTEDGLHEAAEEMRQKLSKS